MMQETALEGHYPPTKLQGVTAHKFTFWTQTTVKISNFIQEIDWHTPYSSAMSWHEHRTEYITSFWGISTVSLYTFDTRTCSVNQKCLSSLALNCHNMWQSMFCNILILWFSDYSNLIWQTTKWLPPMLKHENGRSEECQTHSE